MTTLPPYMLINASLTHPGNYYTAQSFMGYPEQSVLKHTERLLSELNRAGLLPWELHHDELVLWLLNDSPLTESERSIIHEFAFNVDSY